MTWLQDMDRWRAAVNAVHVSGVTTTHPQEHKATASTASGNYYTVIELNLVIKSTDRLD